jgi:predicted aminopeptidase
LLSSYLSWPDSSLANLLLHELAHTKVYVQGDTAFNEGLATFVGLRGSEEWMVGNGEDEAVALVKVNRRQQQLFTELLGHWRAQLSELYQQPLSEFSLRYLKAQIQRQFQECYRINKSMFNSQHYDVFFQTPMNNARFASVANYYRWAGAFQQLFIQSDGDWRTFFSRAENIGKLKPNERISRLEALAEQQIGADTDDQSTDKIQCESFSYHVSDFELSGAEHDDVRRSRNR